MDTWKTEERKVQERITDLKTACQLHEGATLAVGKFRFDYHSAVFNIDFSPQAAQVTLLGVEVTDEIESGTRILFVPWHAVDFIIPADEDD